MERDGLLERKIFGVVPPRVGYSLTAMGRIRPAGDTTNRAIRSRKPAKH